MAMSRRAFLTTSAVAIGAVGFAGWSYLRAAEGTIRLTVTQAHQAALAGDIFLIDVRRPDEWESTGIGEGALPLDMRRKDFIQALDQITGGDKSAPVAVICARGVRSARMTRVLTEAGYTRLIDVPEGMLGSFAGPGWLKAGLPVVAPE